MAKKVTRKPERRAYRDKPKSELKNPDRDYRKETERYEQTEGRGKKGNARDCARYSMKKAGKVKKGDGKDVHHKDGNAGGKKANRKGNLAVVSARKNRSYARTKTAGKKNPRS